MSEPTGSRRRVVLGIDTSVAVAVGVAVDGEVRATRWLDDSRQHVERLTPLIAEAMAEADVTAADLDTIVVGMGPGPFTGLRVGIATALALAEAVGAQVRPVCGLDAVAATVIDPPADFLVLADARRKEVYWARYGADGVRLEGPAVGPADDLPELPVTGPGTALAPQRQPVPGGPVRIDAGVLARIGAELPEVGPEPLYLRQADAVTPTSRKSTLVNRAGRIRLRGPQ